MLSAITFKSREPRRNGSDRRSQDRREFKSPMGGGFNALRPLIS